MGMFGMIGFLSLICAMLIVKDNKKNKSLIDACGLKDNPKFATIYYSIIGLLLVIGSFLSDSYISGFIILLVFIFSVLMSAIIIITKSNKQETV